MVELVNRIETQGQDSDVQDRTLPSSVLIGLDVGSTTVKAVVMDPDTDEILWKDYERHQTKQPEKVFDFLQRMQEAFPVPQENMRIFITGSGGTMLKDHIGAKFVQEVNAVSLAVEHLYPDAGSVVELGGQDAKIIIWFKDPETGAKRKVPSMNDKCAGGTGAVIDKINAKAPAKRGGAPGAALLRRQAPSGGGQVRRLRRDRYKRPSEERRPPQRAHGLPLRGHHPAEPQRSHPWQHPPTHGAPSGWPQHLHPGDAGLLEAQHPQDMGGAQFPPARRELTQGN